MSALAEAERDLALVKACNAAGGYKPGGGCIGSNGQPHETATLERQIADLRRIADRVDAP